MITQTGYDQDDQFTKILFETIERVDLMPIIRYIRENFTPDEIYPADELRDWAEENGYTK